MILKIDSQSSRPTLRRRKGSNLSNLMFGRCGLFWVVISLLLSGTISCKSSLSGTKQKDDQVGEMATVVDYTGTDGCGKLLMLDNGKLLLPLDGMEALEVCHFGQRVSVTYEVQEAMASICMAEDFAASIQTLNILGTESLNWMDDQLSTKSPVSIYRCFESDSNFIYIKTAKKSTLYTIDGSEVCSTPGKAMSDCVRRFNASRQCLIKESNY